MAGIFGMRNTTIGNEVVYDGVGDDDVINSSISQVRFTEDGRIFSGSDRGEVAVWTFENLVPDFNARLVTSEVPQTVYRMIEIPSDSDNEETDETSIRLLTGSLDMRLYDLETGQVIISYDRETEATAFVNDIAITGDNRLAVWAGGYYERVADRTVLARDVRIPILALWDTETGELVRDFNVVNTQEAIAATPVPEETPTDDESNQQIDNSITAVAIHPGLALKTGFWVRENAGEIWPLGI
ncbi:MAG: hypothetical protein Q9P01_04895 [Anaerolineae bacterium]|nr:hypothetical protein [Anaerolineae bacterium]